MTPTALLATTDVLVYFMLDYLVPLTAMKGCYNESEAAEALSTFKNWALSISLISLTPYLSPSF